MKKEISTEAFDQALIKVIADELGCAEFSVERLMAIGGIYEVLSEEFNNAAIDLIELDNQQEDEEDEEDEED